jgi:hypothetical protein
VAEPEPKEELEEEVKHESKSDSKDEAGVSPKNAEDTTPLPA